ncbi:MAG TPA: methyl-accepting chemotaxis protein [Pantanalinema sp.]
MRLTIGRKLLAGFLGVALLALFLGAFSLVQLQKVNGATREMADNWLVATSYVGNLRASASEIQRTNLRLLLERDPGRVPGVETQMAEAKNEFEKHLKLYAPTITASAAHERELFDSIAASYDKFQADVSEVQGLRSSGRMKEAERVNIEKALPAFFGLYKGIGELMRINLDGGAAASKRAASDFSTAFGVTVAVLVVVLLAALTIGLMLSRQITRNLKVIAAAADGIANGDLDQRVEVTTSDELGDMARSFRQMTANLGRIIDSVRTVATTVAASAQQIGVSSEQLAQSAQVQASGAAETSASMEEMAASILQVANNAQTLSGNVEETSSAMEEMAASIQQVAKNSDTLAASVSHSSASIEQMMTNIQQVASNVAQANQVASRANEAAQGGQQAVSQTIEGMTQINQVMGTVVAAIEGLGERSREIGAIVQVIDDIAEQTNLLALNAAIEAARAGEHGRGFAVVADEVRKLAERSARATGEIATLIKGIQQETGQAITSTQQGDARIQDGMRLAQSAGSSLVAIVASVEQVGQLMHQISQATQEQASASQQIIGAVGHMSGLTVQVTEATKEQAAGSEQIILAIANMSRMTHQVSLATGEQRIGSEQVVQAVEDINRSAQEAASATSLIAEATGELQQQARTLLESIAFFKEAQANSPRPAGSLPPLTASLPPLLVGAGR